MSRIVTVDRPTAPKADAYEERSGVTAPASVSVDFDRRVLLHLPDGRVLCRIAGFTK